MRRVFGGLLAVSVFYAIFCALNPTTAHALEPQVWDSNISVESSNPVTYIEVQNRYDCRYSPASTVSLKYPFSYLFSTIPVMVNPIITPLGDKCIIDNQNGQFTSEFLQGSGDTYQTSYYFGNDMAKMFDLSPILSGTTWIDPAPTSNTVLFLVKSSATDKTYAVHTYNDISDANPGIRTNKLTWEFGYQQPQIWKDKDGVAFKIDEHAFSPNGQYMAIHYKSTIAKINLRTMELTPVSYETSLTSSELAISNDGRYVSQLKAGTLFVSDTDSCMVSYGSGAWDTISGQLTYPGCRQSQDIISKLVNDGLIGSEKLYKRPHFSIDSKKLIIGIGSRRTDINTGSSLSPLAFNWLEAVLTANNHVSSTQGYLAMGDSFSSGEGDLQGGTWYEPGTDEQGNKETFEGRNLCHVSRRSYPYLIAKELGYLSGNASSPTTPDDSGLFHSVACSGAVIHNVIGGNTIELRLTSGDSESFRKTENQYMNSYLADLGRWQPGRIKQLDRLDSTVFGAYSKSEPKPKVITLGIGGNDAGFGDTIKACTMPGTCKQAISGSVDTSNLAIRMMKLKPKLVETYKALRSSSPESRVYVNGYPVFVKGSGGSCKPNVLLDANETALVEEGVKYMNQIVRAAALEAGVVYVDVEDILNGVNLCSNADSDGMAVNGVKAGNDIDFRLCIFRTGCLGNESFHPNPTAHRLYSNRILVRTENLSLPMPVEQKQNTPSPGNFFGALAQSAASIINNSGNYSTTIPQPGPFLNKTDQGLQIVQSGLMPGSTLRVELQSTPRTIAQLIVPANGKVNDQIVLPDDVDPGAHELHIIGTTNFGVAIDFYEPLAVAVSDNDFDGDGVLNDIDTCTTVFNSFVDVDNDGVDDACDDSTAITPPPDPVEVTEEVLPLPEVIEQVDPNIGPDKGQPNPETVAGDEEIAPPQVLGASTTDSDIATVQQRVLGATTSLVNTGKETLANLVVGMIVIVSALLVFRAQTRG